MEGCSYPYPDGQTCQEPTYKRTVEGKELCFWHVQEPNKNLRGKNFDAPPNIKEAYLFGADLDEAIFRSAKLIRAELTHAKLNHADFSNSDLTGSTLDKCSAEGINFENATLDYVSAVEANFSAGHFDSVSIRGEIKGTTKKEKDQGRRAKFTRCNFTDTIWDNAGLIWESDFDDARFINAKMDNADFRDCDLAGSKWDNATMWNSNLEGCDLGKASFVNADLRHSSLMSCILDGANLAGARLDRTDFDHSTLHKADLDQIMIVVEETKAEYAEAESVYRALKDFFYGVGYYDVAGHYHYRERVMERKKRGRLDPMRYFTLLLELSFGYGEKPFRLIAVWVLTILVFGATFVLFGGKEIGSAFYTSAEVFLGFTVDSELTDPLIRSLFIIESFIGQILIALLIALVSRKTVLS